MGMDDDCTGLVCVGRLCVCVIGPFAVFAIRDCSAVFVFLVRLYVDFMIGSTFYLNVCI